MSRPETISVLGLWHLGCVVSACWAEMGHRVLGLDRSPKVVGELLAGRAPIFEPDLDALIQANVAAGRLAFGTEFHDAIRASDFVLVAFDTPVDADDQLDLTPLDATVRHAAPFLKADAIVIVSSQVPVGTCARWRDEIRELSGHRTVDIAYSPENLRLGQAIRCYLHPDRIVVGADDDGTRQRVAELFGETGAPILGMRLSSAEMAKHALNGFLATSVSFINEIATLSEVTGADVLSVVEALKTDPRIGPLAFLAPGLGFSGGTLARDLQALKEIGRTRGTDTPLLGAVLEVNRRRPALVLQRLADLYGTVQGLLIGVLGLTYKAGTSTLRRSVALEIIGALARAGATVRAYDPRADLAELDGPMEFEPVATAYDAAERASALVILTEWPEFTGLDFDRIKSVMAKPVIVDGKNLLAGLDLAERGFVYLGVGR